jgi:hypothetical protein
MKLARPVQEVVDLLAMKGVAVRQEIGGRHIKLYIQNRLVGIHPRADAKRAEMGRGAMNVAAQMKRAAREMGINL